MGQEDIDFIVASFVLNYMTAGDWDLLKEIGVKEPQIKKWELSKTLPKKYGDKIDIDMTADVTTTIVEVVTKDQASDDDIDYVDS